MRKPTSVSSLAEFGRVRLSKSFFMRDFLFSDIASIHGFNNVPNNPDRAIAAGTRLCEELLEPLQDAFGRLAIRSAFRSVEVNGFGNEMQRAGKSGYNCASNEANYAGHIWDELDNDGCMGATACVIVPSFWDRFHAEGDWQKLAWWIHDNLPYSSLEFFPKYWAFNIGWHEKPLRRIDHYIPKGCMTKPGMENHSGSHEHLWAGIL
ncbi:hypothetical protein PYR71_13430 [Rhizobium sp. MC63]|uniref:Uncharacterized protein n=1 Tax=Rhizobium mulingense TaxID=3031128 RepID=A0ACC6MYE4_9HYPH|nr:MULTISPECIES: hypothetical protein [unclassified Rhizobium]MDF0697489.1 hypothetical protein [Rhizobium sp. MC63]MEA3518337.1 hypothetical protein [Rhizobium sp. MJ31]